MRFISESEVAEVFTPGVALRAMREAFAALADRRAEMPQRHALGAENDGVYLVMPASAADAGLGTKLVTVHPRNGTRGLPTIHSLYVLQDARTGEVRGVLEARTLTERRTAAVSALAAETLAAAGAAVLGVLGAGPQAHAQAEAHLHAHAYARVLVWNRTRDRAEQLVQGLRSAGHAASLAGSPEELVRRSDVITAATRADRPLVLGDWLRPGQHLDLVGAFRPDMREADVTAVRRARVVVDQHAAARAGAGDLLQAEREGWSWRTEDLADVLAGPGPAGRDARDHRSPDVTLFKSVGLAAEDLFAARAVLDALA